MRAALIFPPQWDPRQPPLAPAVLAGVLQAAEIDFRVFDLNVSLYRSLLQSNIPGGIEDFLLKRLLDPDSLLDAAGYIRISNEVQKIFDEKIDPHGNARLFWDTCGGFPSTDCSRDLQTCMENPDNLPFISHLKAEVARIYEWAPDLIGISVISDTQLTAALALASLFRQNIPNAKIVLGGNAITYRRSILSAHSWLRASIDALCSGDGESFLAAITGDASLSSAPNRISWQKTGEYSTGISRLQDLSLSNSPDFLRLPLEKYLTPHLVMPVETARGCPWGKCSFCIHPVKAATGRPAYRQKPIELVKSEINKLFAAGHKRFFIVDEAIPPSRLRELAVIFGSLSEPVSWIGYARLDSGHNRAGFTLARSSGCRKLFIGVESGSDQILTQFNKGVNSDCARRVLLDAAAAGLAVHFFLMTGFPGEKENDRQATLDLLADVWPAFDPFGVSFDLFPLTAELETDLTANPCAYGWEGPQKSIRNDLAWQFPLLKGPEAAESLAEFKRRLHTLADLIFGTEFGLRHASLAQDSLHLLLLEART